MIAKRRKHPRPVGINSPWQRRINAQLDHEESLLNAAARRWWPAALMLTFLSCFMIACLLSMCSCHSSKHTSTTENLKVDNVAAVQVATNSQATATLLTNIPPQYITPVLQTLSNSVKSAGSGGLSEDHGVTSPEVAPLSWLNISTSHTDTTNYQSANHSHTSMNQQQKQHPARFSSNGFRFAIIIAGTLLLLLLIIKLLRFS